MVTYYSVEINYNICDQGFWTHDEFTIRSMYFDESMDMFSVYATVEMEEVENRTAIGNGLANAEDNMFCFLLFVDGSSEVVLYSNIVRSVHC